jgi:hypothetical protein
VLALAPAVFLSDLDYLVPGEHRVLTHTLTLPAALLGLLVLAWHRSAPAAGRGRFSDYVTAPGWPLVGLLMAYYLTAHAIMDVFTGGVVLLWPFSNTNFFVDVRIILDTSTNTFTPEAETGTSQGPFPLDPKYEWFTNEHAAEFAFVVAALLTAAVLWVRRRGRAKVAEAAQKP